MKRIYSIGDLKERLRDITTRATIEYLPGSPIIEIAAEPQYHTAIMALSAQLTIGVLIFCKNLPFYRCRPARIIYTGDPNPLQLWFNDFKSWMRSFVKFERHKHGMFYLWITSGDGDDYPGCRLSFCSKKFSASLKLPPIVKPYATKVVPKSWDAETIARLGRDYYYKYAERVYGVSYLDNHLSIKYGIQEPDQDGPKEQRWSCFLPWNEWRHIRHSLYDLSGALFYEQFERCAVKLGENKYDIFREAESRVPKACFMFADYDGEVIMATTHIEEREWLRGSSWCKFLSRFMKPMIRRSLDIQFSAETGPRKGSFKGGTIGHGIEMNPNEMHEAAFRRYCGTRNMTFLGKASDVDLILAELKEKSCECDTATTAMVPK